MRILYGVVGEGMGHAIRSRVIIDHLVKNHDVQVVVSGRAHDYLSERVSDKLRVQRIWGLTIVYEDNEVRNFKTLLRNLRGAVAGGWPKNIAAYFRVARQFKPDVVISDFESWSYLFAKNHRIPVVSIDNMQIINRTTHPAEVLEGFRNEFRLSKTIVKAKLPGAFRYLISSFFFPPVSRPRTTLHPPILRQEILDAQPEAGSHLLVYQTSTSFDHLPDILKRLGVECRIYGLRRDLTVDSVNGNLCFRPFSEQRFIDDLRTARAVLTGGGFTLLTEAIYLRKPVLAIPVRKQFEQVLNARYLQHEGYGLCVDSLDAQKIDDFLNRSKAFAHNLARYHQDGNNDILQAVDGALYEAAKDGQAPDALLDSQG